MPAKRAAETGAWDGPPAGQAISQLALVRRELTIGLMFDGHWQITENGG